MIWLQYNKNKNTTMLTLMKRRTYNYYRKADMKKIASQATRERLIKLSNFN